MIGRKGLDVIRFRPAKFASRSRVHDIMSVDSVSSVRRQFQLKSMNVKSLRPATRGFAKASVSPGKSNLRSQNVNQNENSSPVPPLAGTLLKGYHHPEPLHCQMRWPFPFLAAVYPQP